MRHIVLFAMAIAPPSGWRQPSTSCRSTRRPWPRSSSSPVRRGRPCDRLAGTSGSARSPHAVRPGSAGDAILNASPMATVATWRTRAPGRHHSVVCRRPRGRSGGEPWPPTQAQPPAPAGPASPAPSCWPGSSLGTCLTILAMWNGVRLRVPDVPSILGAALGALIVWVLFMAVAAVLSELTVRHHRAALRHGWRYGKRGGAAVAGGPACGPGRGCQVTSVAYADHHGDAAQVGRTRRACRPGTGDPPGAMQRDCPGCGGRSPPTAPARPQGPPGSRPPDRAPARPTRGDPRTARPAGLRMTRRRRIAGRGDEHRRQAIRGHRVPAWRRSRPDRRHLSTASQFNHQRKEHP